MCGCRVKLRANDLHKMFGGPRLAAYGTPLLAILRSDPQRSFAQQLATAALDACGSGRKRDGL